MYMFMNEFDVIIIGGGPAGMFCAYELITRRPGARVLIVEMGKPIRERVCPAQKKGIPCVKCQVCDITHGSSGAGAFSDGKLLLPHPSDRRVRGNLEKHLTLKEAQELYKYTDNLYVKFGATTELKGTKGFDYIRSIAPITDALDIRVKNSLIRHLGTDGAHQVYANLEEYLKLKGVETLFNTEVYNLLIEKGKVVGIAVPGQEIYSDKVVLAIGRSGTAWLEKMCIEHKIENYSGPADIGVRYELPDHVMRDINEILYEGKFIGTPAPYRDKVRTFCQNPSGLVSSESYQGELTLVNGHALLEPASENTNLALLVSLNFAGHNNPIEVTKQIAKTLNMVGHGQPIVQRLGDLRDSHKTIAQSLVTNSVVPTLKTATPGDLAMGMPHRVLADIIGFIDLIEVIAPGFADDDNLLYGPEIKFYSLMLKLSKECETNIKGLYGIGDGSGPTHGLMPASVNGAYAGRILAEKLK